MQAGLASAGVDTSWFNGHSFLIGTAAIAIANGLEDSLIQILGGWWKSSAFTRYIQTPQETFYQCQIGSFDFLISHFLYMFAYV